MSPIRQQISPIRQQIINYGFVNWINQYIEKNSKFSEGELGQMSRLFSK